MAKAINDIIGQQQDSQDLSEPNRTEPYGTHICKPNYIRLQFQFQFAVAVEQWPKGLYGCMAYLVCPVPSVSPSLPLDLVPKKDQRTKPKCLWQLGIILI